MNVKRPSKFIAKTIKIATSAKRLKAWFRISLYRNAVYLILDSAVAATTGFAFWTLAARFYSAEDVGLASAAIAAATMMGLLSTLGLHFGLIRFLPDSGRDSNALINSCFTIGGVASLIIALIFLGGLGFWSPTLVFIRQSPFFFCGFIAFVAAFCLLTLLNTTFIAKRRTVFRLVGHGVIWNLVRLTLVVLLAAFLGASGIFAAWGLGAIVTLAVGILLFLPRVQDSYRPFFIIKRELVNKILHFSFANYIAALLWTAPSLILPLLIVNLLGAEDTAYFYVAWMMSSLLFAIPAGTSFSLLAEGSYDEMNLMQDAKRSVKFTLLLLAPAIVLVFLIGDKLLLLFGTAYSENATTLLWILALSALPMSLNHIYLTVKRVEMKMKIVIGLSAFIAVATLALSYILLPKMGILGVGVGWLTSQTAAALFIMRGFLRSIYSAEVKHG